MLMVTPDPDMMGRAQSAPATALLLPAASPIIGARPRAPTSCVECHIHKIRCEYPEPINGQPPKSCKGCETRGRVCEPRIAKKRGRPSGSSEPKKRSSTAPLGPEAAASMKAYMESRPQPTVYYGAGPRATA